jgi:hypothetical protein
MATVAGYFARSGYCSGQMLIFCLYIWPHLHLIFIGFFYPRRPAFFGLPYASLPLHVVGDWFCDFCYLGLVPLQRQPR